MSQRELAYQSSLVEARWELHLVAGERAAVAAGFHRPHQPRLDHREADRGHALVEEAPQREVARAPRQPVAVSMLSLSPPEERRQ